MVKLENYDIAFSFDDAGDNEGQSAVTTSTEVALLVVENDDLPKIDGLPYSATIKDDILSSSIIIAFKDGDKIVDALECINLPRDVQQSLEAFQHIWFCSLGDEEVVFEHHLPLIK